MTSISHETSATRAGANSAELTSADIIVVGAGFSGLVAAKAIHAAGKQVILLEARDRVGGRVAAGQIAGITVDRGGMWASPAQRRLIDLIEKAGAKTYSYPLDGKGLAFFSSGREEYPGEDTRSVMSEDALNAFNTLAESAHEIAQMIDIQSPWDSPDADFWDSITLDAWVTSQTDNLECRQIWDVVSRGALCCASSEISFLFFLFYMESGGGLEAQASMSGEGVNSLLVSGGMHQIADTIADTLSHRIRLSEPVHSVIQTDCGVTVHSLNRSYSAERVVIALPPTLAGRINYSPALPAHRDAVTQRMPMGSVIKTWVAYSRPFWRDQGCNGLIYSLSHGFEAVYDGTPPDAEIGLLVGFFDAVNAVTWGAKTFEERKIEIIRCLTDAFGPEAANPLEILEADWTAEEWSRGCYGAFAYPGVLTAYKDAIRRPVGRIHWAGTETAREFTGYIEGAIEAGERAAAEVLEGLST
jgi:monoamine oxidase